MNNGFKILLTQEVIELQTILEWIENGDIQRAVDFTHFCINDRKNQLWKSGIEDVDEYISTLPTFVKEQLIKRSKRQGK